jgi:hypothetical protein
MKRCRIDAMFGPTRWAGNKAKELGEGYKINYGLANKEGRFCVGIILSKELKNLVTEENRKKMKEYYG